MVRGVFFDRTGKQIDVQRWRVLVTSPGYTRIATATVGATTVRTVWLGLDPDDPYAVFATLVCDDAGAKTVRRYHTELSALDGHAEVCFELSANAEAAE